MVTQSKHDIMARAGGICLGFKLAAFAVTVKTTRECLDEGAGRGKCWARESEVKGHSKRVSDA